MAWRYYQASLLSSSRKSVAQSWVSVAMFKTLRTRRCWRWSLPVISGRKKSGFGLGRQDETMPNQRDGCDSQVTHPPSESATYVHCSITFNVWLQSNFNHIYLQSRDPHAGKYAMRNQWRTTVYVYMYWRNLKLHQLWSELLSFRSWNAVNFVSSPYGLTRNSGNWSFSTS